MNLLSNAIKFTNSGEISIVVSHRANSYNEGVLSVRIIDTGIGIDDVMKKNLFEPFSRGQNPEVQKVSGSGLGLALSGNLARLLGGSLSLVATTVGVGSEFELLMSTGPMEQLQFPQKVSTSPSSNKLEGDKILVVDDAEDLRILMSRYLERQGAQVNTCVNGLEALDFVSRNDVDLILMDMKMPVMDGYQATAKLRSQGFRKPIIAVTAHASLDDKNKSLEAGCNFYLSKPVDSSFLTETIKQYVTQNGTVSS